MKSDSSIKLVSNLVQFACLWMFVNDTTTTITEHIQHMTSKLTIRLLLFIMLSATSEISLLTEPMSRKVGGNCSGGPDACDDPNASCTGRICVCNTNYQTKASDATCGTKLQTSVNMN